MQPSSKHQRMDSRQALRAAGFLLAGMFFVFSAGCLKQALFLAYLIGGPPSIDPDFDVQTSKSMTATEDITVAVVCFAPKELKWDVSEIDEDLGKYLSHRLAKHKIKVITPQRVQDWLDKNPEWDRPDEIGAEFKTTYVIFVELEDYNLFEKGNQNLYRGRAEVNVSVWEMDKKTGEGDVIYRKQLTSQYPLAIGRPTSEITYSRFKKAYLSRLSEEIGRLFYEHYNGADIQDAT